MTIQSIRTEGGEELVVLSRREYDALLAQLRLYEDEEDAVLSEATREVLGRIDRGEEGTVPGPAVDPALRER